MNSRRILFVCSGNTCRSPMAEAIARQWIESRGAALAARSAGLGAVDGSAATPEAQEVARRHGLDLTGHRATRLDEEELRWADLVLGMTHAHVDAVRRLDPAVRTVPLTAFLPRSDPGAGLSVTDPYGGTVDEYEDVWRILEEAVPALLERIVKSAGDD